MTATAAQRAVISRFGLVDVTSFETVRDVDSLNAAPDSVMGFTPDAQDHDQAIVIEPDGRILTDVSGVVEPYYL